MKTELVPKSTPIVGREDEVRRALATLYRTGRLITPARDIQLRRIGNGLVAVNVLTMTPPAIPWRKRHPVLLTALVASALGVGMVLGAIALIRAAASAIADIDGPLALGILLLAGALALAILANRSNHRGACPGVAVHCKGCKH